MSGKLGNAERKHGQAVDTDTLFSILSSERRRHAIYCLQRYRNPMKLADLADEVARIETDDREVTGEVRKSVYTMLYHVDVPKLAEANVVEYDRDADTVRLNHEFASLDLEGVVDT